MSTSALIVSQSHPAAKADESPQSEYEGQRARATCSWSLKSGRSDPSQGLRTYGYGPGATSSPAAARAGPRTIVRPPCPPNLEVPEVLSDTGLAALPHSATAHARSSSANDVRANSVVGPTIRRRALRGRHARSAKRPARAGQPSSHRPRLLAAPALVPGSGQRRSPRPDRRAPDAQPRTGCPRLDGPEWPAAPRLRCPLSAGGAQQQRRPPDARGLVARIRLSGHQCASPRASRRRARRGPGTPGIAGGCRAPSARPGEPSAANGRGGDGPVRAAGAAPNPGPRGGRSSRQIAAARPRCRRPEIGALDPSDRTRPMPAP